MECVCVRAYERPRSVGIRMGWGEKGGGGVSVCICTCVCVRARAGVCASVRVLRGCVCVSGWVCVYMCTYLVRLHLVMPRLFLTFRPPPIKKM